MLTTQTLGTAHGTIGLSEVLSRTADVARNIVRPRAEAVDAQGIWPAENLRALLEAGLGGLAVSREHGGLGHGLLAVARVCEVLGQECASTALCFGMHLVGSAVISAKATAEQRSEFLDPICAGRHLTTLALSEPGTGAHFYLPQTGMSSTADGYLVNGAKSFVTSGNHADSYVVSATAPEADAPAGQFSCVVIPGGAAGVTWGGSWNGFGMRGNSSVMMELRNVSVPRSHLLGNPGDQIWYVFEVVAPFFLMAMAGTYLGVASAAFNAARDHLSARRYQHSGGGPGSSPVLQHRIGSLWAEVERARQLVYSAAAFADSRPEEALLGILSAKAEVGDCAVHVANEALTLTGGIAYRDDSRLARCLRDARAAHVMSPTTDLLRLWTGRALLGVPLLAD